MPGRGQPWKEGGLVDDTVTSEDIKEGTIQLADLESSLQATAGSGGHVIEDEGTPLTDRPTLNFVGEGVVASDDGEKTVVTIPGGIDSFVGSDAEKISKVVKPTQENVLNSTTLQDDDDLFIALEANTVYAFTANLICDADVATDVKIQWSIPTGATMAYEQIETANAFLVDNTTNVILDGVGANNLRNAVLYGRVITAGTVGNLQLRWAQNNIDAVNDATINEGSFIEVVKA